jgi:uncharacterized protein (TIGR03086 family)
MRPAAWSQVFRRIAGRQPPHARTGMCGGLVSHLVSGNLRAAELGAGGTIDQAGDRLDGDVLSAGPAAACAASARAASDAFRRPGALDAPCAVSYGPVAGSVYAGHRFIDVLIHGWDLVTATGQDATLDGDLAEARRQVADADRHAANQRRIRRRQTCPAGYERPGPASCHDRPKRLSRFVRACIHQ